MAEQPPEVFPIPDRMDLVSYVLNRGRIPSGAGWSPGEKERAKIDWTLDEQVIHRASFLLRLHQFLVTLGVENPHDPGLLSIQPFHPYDPQTVRAKLLGLGHDSTLADAIIKAGLSVASLDLLSSYFHPTSVYSELKKDLQKQGLASDYYLADPYYGFVFYRNGEQLRNHNLALADWVAKVSSLPEPLARESLENSIASLYQGVEMARLLFGPFVGAEGRRRYEQNEVAEVIVRTEAEFMRLVDGLQSLARALPKVELWFRGQNEDYLMPDRSGLVEHGIAPYSDIRDSSLVPNVYRHIDEHAETLEGLEAFTRELGDWVFHADSVLEPGFVIKDIHTGEVRTPKPATTDMRAVMQIRAKGQPHDDAPAITDLGFSTHWKIYDSQGNLYDEYIKEFYLALSSYQRGLLLQHYGCPTAWLDITRDPQVALWFALKSLRPVAGTSALKVNDLAWLGDSPARWPTVMVFPLVPGFHNYLDSGAMLRHTPALRPVRQKCGLLFGGGNFARNYAARYIGLKIRLAPGFKARRPPSAEELFPDADEDKVLKGLLELQDTLPVKRKYPVYYLTRLV